MTDPADVVNVETDGPVATLTINRPESYNALNSAVLTALSASLQALVGAGEVRAIIITGRGDRAFCAGADLNELAGLDTAEAHRVLASGQQAFTLLEQTSVPVIAAVNGLALGGGFELVLACTFPIVSAQASFGLPESGLGLIPGYGGTQRLPRVIGRPAAAHVMLSGERLSAQRAYQLGVTPIEPVEPEQLMDTAREVAGSIAARGPCAQEAILRALRTASPSDAELALETTLAALATAGEEATEGVAAFKEKRTPSFPPRKKNR